MKRPIIPPEQLSKETQHLCDVLNEATDVAAVVVGAAFLDASLGSLLAKFMLRESTIKEKLLSPSGALGSYQARTDAAYALALIGKRELTELSTVGSIRNLFAHSHLHLTFADAEAQTLCNKLSSWRIGNIGEMLAAEATNIETTPEDRRSAARAQFTLAVVLLSQRLIVNARSLGGLQGPEYPRWKQMRAPDAPKPTP